MDRQNSPYPRRIAESADLPGLYRGTVMQRTDPDRLGRLRVKVAGLFDGIVTEDLPWAWPLATAFPGGGVFFIPQVGSVVRIFFEGDDPHYPVWAPGWWGEDDTAQGKGVTAHRQWPTSWFGGQSWGDGPLKMESNANPKDAPNNFALASALQKRLELDDRKGRERLVLADRHDSFLWVNTEDGVISVEAAGGNSGTVAPMGMVFSTKTGQQGIQAYTYQRWQFTVSDTQKAAELTSPRGLKLKLSDQDQRLEAWTTAGHKLIMDDQAKALQFLSASGVGLFIKDSLITITAGQTAQMTFDMSTGNIEMRATGTFKLHSDGDMTISSTGKMAIDAEQGLFLNSADEITPVQARPVDPVFTAPPTMDKIPRACDFPYYATAE